jgi:sec-independent protein translocase protein TatB
MIPGMGGLELVVIALAALVVIGPKDLPMLLRRLGKFTAKVRGMANEFRASFDELARQSELDELRKEVEALREQQIHPLGAETAAHFSEINAGLSDLPQVSTSPLPDLEAPPSAETKPKRTRKKPAETAPGEGAAQPPAKPRARRATKAKPEPDAATPIEPKPAEKGDA